MYSKQRLATLVTRSSLPIADIEIIQLGRNSNHGTGNSEIHTRSEKPMTATICLVMIVVNFNEQVGSDRNKILHSM